MSKKEDIYKIIVILLLTLITILLFLNIGNGRYQYHSKYPIILDTKTGEVIKINNQKSK